MAVAMVEDMEMDVYLLVLLLKSWTFVTAAQPFCHPSRPLVVSVTRNRKRDVSKRLWTVIVQGEPKGMGGVVKARVPIPIFPLFFFTLNMPGPSLLGLTRSISWSLMPWLLASPGHQQPWYWLCRIGRSLFYLRGNFNYLCLINVEEWHKM